MHIIKFNPCEKMPLLIEVYAPFDLTLGGFHDIDVEKKFRDAELFMSLIVSSGEPNRS
jgi:hypothetical protein